VAAPKKSAADEVWNKIQTENSIPPLEFNGITLEPPTKKQIEAWRAATNIEEGERALFAEQFDAIHELFDNAPNYMWENFNVLYLKHFFGTGDESDLKG
jgi:hypothetical protein